MNQTRRWSAGLVAGSLLLSACGAGSGPDATASLPVIELTGDDAMLASVVDRTATMESFGYAMVLEMGFPAEFSEQGMPTTMRFEVDGAVDTVAQTSTMKMDLSSMLEAMPDSERAQFDEVFGDGTIEMVQSGTKAYMRFPALTGMLGSDSDWVAIPADASADVMASTGVMFEDPEDLLTGLPQGATITEVGQETIQGVSTTKFQLDANLDGAGAGDLGDAFDELLGGSTSFVWIDQYGLIRRFEMSFNMFGMTGGTVVEFFDFGREVNVSVPSDYVELDPALLAAFG